MTNRAFESQSTFCLRARAILVVLYCLTAASALLAADYPAPEAGDYVIRDFRFRSGEVLPELRMHYCTFGTPRRDAQGIVRNAVLILHGTTGSSGQFLRAEFAGELFGQGQPLDARRYFLVLPDNLGHGKSSKPNDVLYALESSGDYDPGPGLERIHARLFAVNFADDLINPPELGVLEREIKRVKHGKAMVLPLSDRTRGHGTHTLAAIWKKHLAKLLKQSER